MDLLIVLVAEDLKEKKKKLEKLDFSNQLNWKKKL